MMSSSYLSNGSESEHDHEEEDDSSWYCVDCGTSSPKTKTAHTLISSKHGWRLSRIADEQGGYRFEWRCPPCWAAHKQHPPSSKKR
ncbi:MAG: hypothetical protein HOW73_23830 [Polyangiaceae bacterium]|nr:hypothetical protein [Polyangiaceae bacterium]